MQTIRISGDSGDGIQIIGNILASTIAQNGYYINTIPDYPSEIRAPIGTIEGVSSFEVSFGIEKNLFPTQIAQILIILNPAALRLNEKYITQYSFIIINSATFTEDGITKAGYDSNPIKSGKYNQDNALLIDLDEEIKKSLHEFEVSINQKLKCKNFFILGNILAQLGLEPNYAEAFINKKFGENTTISSINSTALKSGFDGEVKFKVQVIKNDIRLNKFKILSGNEIQAYALINIAKTMGKKLYFSGYPITPASNIMHTLARYRQKDIIVMQAEDEISAIGGAIGGSYAGAIGVTATSGPGFSLKSEALNLAVMTELPLLVIDVQRGGPSTGLPTKTEQSDLFQALFGRHGESPIVVMAIDSNYNSFEITQKAIKIAIKYMTPVVLLSDSYLANNSTIFEINQTILINENLLQELPSKELFSPYIRDEKTLARPWATPGIKGYEHRIGGLEKDNQTGNISYNGENHELMTILRTEKIMKVQDEIPETIINGEYTGDLLIIGWGSTYSSIIEATKIANKNGQQVSSIHLVFINPLPKDLEKITKGFKQILVVEENLGQLSFLLTGKLGIRVKTLNKIKGQKILPGEIITRINELI